MADAPELIGLLVACAAAAAAILMPDSRWQPLALAIALVAAPILVLGDVWDGPRVTDLRDSPAMIAAALVAGAVAVGIGALVMRRIEWAFPVLAFAALALRLPVRFGGETSNLLIPLYLVIASQLAATWGRERPAPADEPTAVVWLRRVLAATLVLYAIQAAYSEDVSNAIENAGFFLVPFAILFCQLAAFRWDERAIRAAAISIGAVGAALAVVGARPVRGPRPDPQQGAPRLEPDQALLPRQLGLLRSERVRPLHGARHDRDGRGDRLVARRAGGMVGARLGVVMLAGLALSFSLTSIAAMLAGLGLLALLRYGLVGGIAAAAAILLTGAVLVVSGGLDRPDVGPTRGFDEETSGRGALLEGGFDLIEEEPLAGWGSGSFGRAYFDHVRKTETTASHSEPITVAAEQGIPGALVYVGLLATMAWALLGAGVRSSAGRAAAAAGIAALVVHSLGYAGFLTDPATWALLAVAVALRRTPSE